MPATKRAAVLNAWEHGDLKRSAIARELHVDGRQVKAWIEEGLASGEVTRSLDDKQLRIARDPGRDPSWGWRGAM